VANRPNIFQMLLVIRKLQYTVQDTDVGFFYTTDLLNTTALFSTTMSDLLSLAKNFK